MADFNFDLSYESIITSFLIADNYLPVRAMTSTMGFMGEVAIVGCNRERNHSFDIIENDETEYFVFPRFSSLYDLLVRKIRAMEPWSPNKLQYKSSTGFVHGKTCIIHADVCFYQTVQIMETLRELASNVNFAADAKSYVHIQNKFEERADAFYNYCINSPQEILSLNSYQGYQVGRAFYHLVNKMNEPNNDDEWDDLDDIADKFRFSLACAVVCLTKAIEMGTVQSGIAARCLFELLKKYRNHFPVTLSSQSNEYVREIIPDSEAILSLITLSGTAKQVLEKRLVCILTYLVEITRLEEAFKNADMNTCRVGQLYLDALCIQLKREIHGFQFMGIITL